MSLFDTDQLGKWKHRLLFPYLRRKDAGYLANVLSEYATFSQEIKRTKLKDRFSEVERCYTALLIARDEDPKTEEIRLRQLRHAVKSGVEDVGESDPLTPDPVVSRIWVQGYMRQIFLVEKAILELQNFPDLIARAPFLLERFRVVVDQKAEYLKRQYDQELSSEKLSKLWDDWVKRGMPGDQTPEETWLRAKMVTLLNDIHWWYAQSQVREEMFLGQQFAVIATFLVGISALLLYWWLGVSDFNSRITVIVLFFGMLGAFTSVMRRMRNDVEQHGGGTESSYKELTALAYGKIGITFALFFGAVFALVLMLLFQGEIAKSVFNAALGDLIFPKVPLTWPDRESCESACLSCLSSDAVNFGRLMVWSFIAGFAEQLVPDALDRLTKAAEPKKNT